MPWAALLSGATGGLAALIIAALFVGKIVVTRTADAATQLLEARLKRQEDLHKSAIDFSSTVDTDLRDRRIPVYKDLWEKTGRLPIRPWNTELSYSDLEKLTHELRDWYFKSGGLFLSQTSRDAYFEVQDCIMAMLSEGTTGLVAKEDYDTIVRACSSLRTQLTNDILSRREAPAQ